MFSSFLEQANSALNFLLGNDEEESSLEKSDFFQPQEPENYETPHKLERSGSPKLEQTQVNTNEIQETIKNASEADDAYEKSDECLSHSEGSATSDTDDSLIQPRQKLTSSTPAAIVGTRSPQRSKEASEDTASSRHQDKPAKNPSYTFDDDSSESSEAHPPKHALPEIDPHYKKLLVKTKKLPEWYDQCKKLWFLSGKNRKPDCVKLKEFAEDVEKRVKEGAINSQKARNILEGALYEVVKDIRIEYEGSWTRTYSQLANHLEKLLGIDKGNATPDCYEKTAMRALESYREDAERMQACRR